MSRSLVRRCLRGLALAGVVVLILHVGLARVPAQVRATIRAGDMPLGPVSPVSVAFSPDGKLLGTRGMMSLSVWDAVRGKQLWRRGSLAQSMPAPGPPLFSPDGQLVALPVHSGNDMSEVSIEILNARKGTVERALDKPLRPITWQFMPPRSMAFSPDGRLLAATGLEQQSADFMVRIWDVKTGKAPAAIRLGKHADGRFTVEAEFVKAIGGKVTLRKRDGTKITVPMKKLSEDDRRVIRGR